MAAGVMDEDAAVSGVTRDPVFPTAAFGEEGVGEIGSVVEGAGEWGRRVGRLHGVEAFFVAYESEERRRVPFAVAAEEGAVGDDAVESGAGG